MGLNLGLNSGSRGRQVNCLRRACISHHGQPIFKSYHPVLGNDISFSKGNVKKCHGCEYFHSHCSSSNFRDNHFIEDTSQFCLIPPWFHFIWLARQVAFFSLYFLTTSLALMKSTWSFWKVLKCSSKSEVQASSYIGRQLHVGNPKILVFLEVFLQLKKAYHHPEICVRETSIRTGFTGLTVRITICFPLGYTSCLQSTYQTKIK